MDTPAAWLIKSSVPDTYARFVARSEEYLAAQMAQALAPEKVAIAIAIAIAATRRNPRPRYLVPARSKPLISLLATLPDRLADRAKRQALGR